MQVLSQFSDARRMRGSAQSPAAMRCVGRCAEARAVPWLALLGALLCGSAPSLADVSAPSLASNYGTGVSVSLNARTAGVSWMLPLFRIPGIRSEMDATLSLSYRSEDAISSTQTTPANQALFGLPGGWTFNLSYVLDNGSYQSLYLNGNQSYVIDADWQTYFTPSGTSTPVLIKTGLKLYNRAGANYQLCDAPGCADPDSSGSTLTVNGLVATSVFSSLNGMARYFSAGGLLLEQRDRFGNKLRYTYTDSSTGEAASASTTPITALPATILDTWGQTISFQVCEPSDTDCVAGETVITLPDGRTVGYVASDTEVTQVIDAQGKVSYLSYTTPSCDVNLPMPAELTTASGLSAQVTYTCMDVCTQPAASDNCQEEGNSQTWPVGEYLYQCPSNASGESCPSGSASEDYVTTQVVLGDQTYTGYPLYSPFAPNDTEGGDALMSSGDTGFTYTTQHNTYRAGSPLELATQVTSTYDFLHLLTDAETRVQPTGGTLFVSKATSYCYLASPDQDGCSLAAADYYQLAANYQSPTIVGSCMFAQDATQARLWSRTRAYDSFGKIIHNQVYHGGQNGVVSSCTSATRLADPSASALTLVLDEYRQHDTPGESDLDTSQYLALGAAGAHFGLLLGQEAFYFLDNDELGLFGTLAQSTSPTRVTLLCNALASACTDGGEQTAQPSTTLASSAFGLLANDASAPSTDGVIAACQSPSWDTSVAQAKLEAYTSDCNGRPLAQVRSWVGGTSQSLQSVTDSFTYTLTSSNEDEESCANVLQTSWTDGDGDTSLSRRCTENAYLLSASDANGNTTLYQHNAMGLVTQLTHPNGALLTRSFSYACPQAPDGTDTCPAALSSAPCPYDDADPARSCVVMTGEAGSDPDTGVENQSYADGVFSVAILDGLGRIVETRDNLGGVVDEGYQSVQTRQTSVYDSLDLLSSTTQSVGVTDPLEYTRTTEYGPRLRPQTVCGPRSNALQFVHDDVGQQVVTLFNGSQRLQVGSNDSSKQTQWTDCPLLSGNAVEAGTTCPTVASDLSQTSCTSADQGYVSGALYDGGRHGALHTTSVGPAGSATGQVTSIQGTATVSADKLTYQYSWSSQGSGALSAQKSWTRDLNARTLESLAQTSVSGSDSSFSSDTRVYDAVGRVSRESTLLDGSTSELFDYTPTHKLAKRTSYAGDEFSFTYDSRDWLVRHCYADPGTGGTQGETIERDAITGKPTQITHFTNPSSTCSDDASQDVIGELIGLSYTPFGAPLSKVYQDGDGTILAQLSYAYDLYGRQVCQADTVASAAGNACPDSPTAADWQPAADEQLLQITYYPQDDDYRRGLVQSQCRGVVNPNADTETDTPYITQCVQLDYYTSEDTGGACDASGLTDLTGAFAGKRKSRTICTGEDVCAPGSQSLIAQSTYLYDAFARPCTVTSTDTDGEVIFASEYLYDAYDDIVQESHSSDLDASTASNYQKAYTYDGLLRLIEALRSDSDGNPLETTTYSYDAAGNILSKVVSTTQESAQPIEIEVAYRENRARRRRLIQVTLRGSETLDVSRVDPASLRLGTHKVAPVKVFEKPTRGKGRRKAYRDLVALFRARPTRGERTDCLVGVLFDGTRLYSCPEDAASSTTYTRTYNADGALTSVTQQSDGETASTRYLSWDNFIPTAGDASSGTYCPGNGNLVGIGPAPGDSDTCSASDTSEWSAQYDLLDRLVGFDNGTQTQYGYHPDYLLASAALSSDTSEGFAFYYQRGVATNLEQSAQGLASRRLGPVRYLSDGSQALRLSPYKDISGVYTPASDLQSEASWSAYDYSPYGALPDDGSASGYDLAVDPYRYGGQFRDPVSGFDYLRARFYAPDLESFLQRDPSRQMNRFAYANANPIRNSDPRGLKSRGLFEATKRGFVQTFKTGFGIKTLLQHPKNPWAWTQVGMLALGVVGGGEEVFFGGPEARSFLTGIMTIGNASLLSGHVAYSIVEHQGWKKIVGSNLGALGAGLLTEAALTSGGYFADEKLGTSEWASEKLDSFKERMESLMNRSDESENPDPGLLDESRERSVSVSSQSSNESSLIAEYPESELADEQYQYYANRTPEQVFDERLNEFDRLSGYKQLDENAFRFKVDTRDDLLLNDKIDEMGTALSNMGAALDRIDPELEEVRNPREQSFNERRQAVKRFMNRYNF